jgi:hypothetical protein
MLHKVNINITCSIDKLMYLLKVTYHHASKLNTLIISQNKYSRVFMACEHLKHQKGSFEGAFLVD